MKQFVLEHLAQEATEAEHIRQFDCETTEADMLIDLANGQRIGIYVINRAVRIPEIRERYERNTARGIHTLFILDGRMLPDDQDEIEPPTWLNALHTLADGRVYAYWCDRRTVTLRPVHMEWQWGESQRRAQYGPTLDVKNLRARRIECASKHIEGLYASADFAEGPFWKKQAPGEDYQQFKYSWRQWRYTGTNTQREEPREEEQWDPWEAFARHYGHVGGVGGNSEGGRYRRQQRQTYESFPSASPTSRYYAVLGVPMSASFDEVKRAYRSKARQYHPDLHPDEKEHYTAKMADINEAFEAISKALNKAN